MGEASGITRRLTAIVVIDIAGYSARVERNETDTVSAVMAFRNDVTRAAKAFGGSLFKSNGDGFLLEFPTVTGALQAADALRAVSTLPIRIGLHLGEVTVTEDDDLLGHGVNVAARLQAKADVGEIWVSSDVVRAVRGDLARRFASRGTIRLDKMKETLPVYAFEPAGDKARRAGLRPRKSWRFVGSIVALLAIIAIIGGAAGLWKFGRHWLSPSEGPQVAIAPFEVIKGDETAKETAKAVASDALSALGANSVQAVAVTGVSSAPSPAHLVLNGEIQQTKTEARVTLHLFDPEAKAILWSGDVIGDPTNLAGLQQQASLKAADMVTCGLGAYSPAANLDSQARVLWLRTCDAWRQLGTLGQARDSMQIVMQRAPRFSGAYAKYALATARMLPIWVPSGQAAARDQARAAALQALRLNPDEAAAYVALSLTEPETDWYEQEQWLLKGLEHAPNSSDLISWQASLLERLGRTAEGLALARRGVELDPLSPVKAISLADWLYFAGETAEATKVVQHAMLTWPQSPDMLDLEFERAVRDGDGPAVIKKLSSAQTRPVEMPDAEALLWPKIMAARHASSEARGALAKQVVDLVQRRQFVDFWGYLALHVLNEDDLAYSFMLKLSKSRNGISMPKDIAAVLFQPEMANLREQPRFMDIAANLGLTSYWLRSGKWPDFCSDPHLSYSCALQARAAEKAAFRR